MKLSKKIYYSGCSLFPTGLVKKIVRPDTLFPYHHLVDDGDVLHVKHLYTYKNTRQFQEDLDELLRHLRPVSAEEVAEAVKAERPVPGNSFLLTFDDGFRQFHDTIAPILYAKGVPSIFFVNPAFLDNQLLFYRCKISLAIEALLQQRGNEAVVRKVAEVLGETGTGIETLLRSLRDINNLNQHLLDLL